MNILITYASKYGTTEKAVSEILKYLTADTYNCRNKVWHDGALTGEPSVSKYDTVIIGSPMYMGSPLKEIKQFCKRNEEELVKKDVIFFTCGIGSREEDENYLRKHIPQSLFGKNTLYYHFGAEMQYDRMNVMERFAMKKYEETHGPVSGIDKNLIEEFCSKVNSRGGQ